MIIVLGNSPKKVELKDLDDCVYYKQQKVFSDEQYRRSADLKREIENGRLIKLQHKSERTGTYDPSSSFSFPETSLDSAQEKNPSSDKLEQLLERIDRLEESLKSKPESEPESAPVPMSVPMSAPAQPGSEILGVLLEKIERLEKAVSAKESSKGLDDIISRLEEMVSNGGGGYVSSSSRKETGEEPVYIPNLSVEDGSSHIKLDVRQIDNGDSLSDSLRKLRELRSKSK